MPVLVWSEVLFWSELRERQGSVLTCLSFQFQLSKLSKKERVIQELEMHLRNHFVDVLK